MSVKPSIVWFRHDLRLEDNTALQAALHRDGAVIPVFIWAPEEEGEWPLGAASRWWLHQSVKSLQASLQKAGSDLIIRRGPSLETLRELVKETGADAVFWCHRYEPPIVARDEQIRSALSEEGLHVEGFGGSLLFEPGQILSRERQPLRVFGPFWKALLARAEPRHPYPAPEKLPVPESLPKSLPLDSLELEPKVDWASGLRERWKPGEAGAHACLEVFLEKGLAGYQVVRDRPDLDETSCLSPHLRFGEISPRTVWHAVRTRSQQLGTAGALRSAESFLRELAWREFAYHLLAQFPEMPNRPFRPEFEKFPWRNDLENLRAWQQGNTGVPMVDAGMRQLWTAGWMPNRVRMVVASFLVKDLLIDWREGARWFWDTLVDADPANNALNWQWVAGCGPDASPFFRVFNPIAQGIKFDPDGDYVRKWVPELDGFPGAHIHDPGNASGPIRSAAGKKSAAYPKPLVQHARARQRALDALAKVRGASGASTAPRQTRLSSLLADDEDE